MEAVIKREEGVLIVLGQAVGDRIIVVDNIAYALSAYIAFPAVQGFIERREFSVGIGFFLPRGWGET